MSNIQDVRNLIHSYSEFRGLVEPGELKSLLFFVSEVGELVEAYAEAHKGELDESVWILLYDMHNVGLRADDQVTRMNPYWKKP